jgi:hypothetical protein
MISYGYYTKQNELLQGFSTFFFKFLNGISLIFQNNYLLFKLDADKNFVVQDSSLILEMHFIFDNFSEKLYENNI